MPNRYFDTVAGSSTLPQSPPAVGRASVPAHGSAVTRPTEQLPTLPLPQRRLRMPPLVGLIGPTPARSDCFVDRLVQQGYHRIDLDGPLKLISLALDPFVALGVSEEDSLFPARRMAEMVDEYGWEVLKTEVPEVARIFKLREAPEGSLWLRWAMAEADLHPGPTVLTDVRYPSEAHAVLTRGGVLLRIGEGAHHKTLDNLPADLVIRTPGSPEDLVASADLLHRRLTAAAARPQTESRWT